MGMTMGPTTKLAVTDSAAAEWTNTYSQPVELRIIGDVAFHVAIPGSGDATAEDMYVSIYDDVCIKVGVGQNVSVIGEEAGNVYITKVD